MTNEEIERELLLTRDQFVASSLATRAQLQALRTLVLIALCEQDQSPNDRQLLISELLAEFSQKNLEELLIALENKDPAFAARAQEILDEDSGKWGFAQR